MRTGAPLVLIAPSNHPCAPQWQLMLIESIRAMHRYGDNPHSLSNIELLVPLMVSDDVASDESDASAAGERYERSRFDKDMPFSNIPASAFVLDESALPVAEKKKRGHKHSRKQDLAYRPRSVYLESVESEASDERSEQDELGADLWHACQRLTRSQVGHQHELLLLLCAELLDAPPAPPSLSAPPHTAGCPCCQQNPAPLWGRVPIPARRELVPIGDDPYMVQSYMRSRGRKRRHHMPYPSQE